MTTKEILYTNTQDAFEALVGFHEDIDHVRAHSNFTEEELVELSNSAEAWLSEMDRVALEWRQDDFRAMMAE